MPDCIVDDVLRAVHSFAHPGLSNSGELFQRRYTCHASAFGTKEAWSGRVSGAVGTCQVCRATKARRGLQRKACHEQPIPSHVFSAVAMDFFDLPPEQLLYSEEMVNCVFTIVCRLTGCIVAIPCKKNRD